MTMQELVQRVDQLIEMGNGLLDTQKMNVKHSWVNAEQAIEFRAASLSFIANLYGDKHTHFTEFYGIDCSYVGSEVEEGRGILKAIRGEIEGGWLFTIKGLVTAEVFADFLEMAEHLLESHYKDPAAVVTGSVLEEHLRQLCVKNGISVTRQKEGKDVPLKADSLNSELVKADVYTKLDQKQITAWLDLRNKAAHGKYDEYNDDQVKRMMEGIIEFMARVPV